MIKIFNVIIVITEDFFMNSDKIIKSPRKAVAKFCKQCCCDSSTEVINCPVIKCPLWFFRVNPTLAKGIKFKIKIIKEKCFLCSENKTDAFECTHNNCLLWPFRKGKNTFRKKRELSEKEKIKMKIRLSKYRKIKNEN